MNPGTPPASVPYASATCRPAASGPAKIVGLDSLSQWNSLGPTDFGGPAAFGEATDGDGDGNDSRGLSGGFALKMVDFGRSPYSP